MHKSVAIRDSFYGVSSRSCLWTHQPFYSPLKCHKAVLSLIFSFLLKTSKNLTFLPSFLVKIFPLPHTTNWIWLKTFSYFFFFHLTSLRVLGNSPLGCELLESGHYNLFTACIFDALLIFFNVKVASKLT